VSGKVVAPKIIPTETESKKLHEAVNSLTVNFNVLQNENQF